MKIVYAIITFFVLGLLLSSCTMEKRLYRPGWSIQWNDKVNNKIQSEKNDIEIQDTGILDNAILDIGIQDTEIPHARIPDDGITDSVYSDVEIVGNDISGYKDKSRSKDTDGYQRINHKSKIPPRDRDDEKLIIGIILFFAGLAIVITVASVYSGGVAITGLGTALLIAAIIMAIIGYVFVEEAVPGLGCLLFYFFQFLIAVLS